MSHLSVPATATEAGAPRRTRSVAPVVIALSAAMVVALVPGVPAPVRAAIAVAFFIVAPGLAWVRALPADGPVEQVAVVVALSLAVDVVVAEALVYAGLTGAAPVLAVLVAVALLGLWCTRGRVPDPIGDDHSDGLDSTVPDGGRRRSDRASERRR